MSATPLPSSLPVVSAESHHIVRERRFVVDAGDDSVLAALAHLRREHITGTLLVDIACGGIATLRFREEQKVTFDEK